MWDAPSLQALETPRDLRGIISAEELADLIDATLDMGGDYFADNRGELELLTLVQPGQLPIRLAFSHRAREGRLLA